MEEEKLVLLRAMERLGLVVENVPEQSFKPTPRFQDLMNEIHKFTDIRIGSK